MARNTYLLKKTIFTIFHFSFITFLRAVNISNSDPRDMALSYRKIPTAVIVHGARQWKADQQKSLLTFIYWPEIQAIHVNYESLIGSFKEEVTVFWPSLRFPTMKAFLIFTRIP